MGNHQVNVEELQNISALHHMQPEQLEHLAAIMIRRTYTAGQLIFLEGNQASGIWFILEGRVIIAKQSFNGRAQGLCLVDRVKCFGGCPMFDGEINLANAQAVDDVTLLILPQSNLQRLIQNNPELSWVLLQIFSRRLVHLAQLSEGLGTWTTAQRINDCLLAYCDQSEPHPIVFLTHENLAALSGTVREVVTRHLSRLEKGGFIQIEPGKITLLDKGALHSPCLDYKSSVK